MRRRWVMAALVAAPWAILACEEVTPTSPDDEFPVDPPTVEVLLTFEEFAEALTIYGGYGTAAELGSGVLAHEFAGDLDARTLVRWSQFPFRASVRDSVGTVRPDSNFTFVGGRVVARIDTVTSTNVESDAPVTLALGALTFPWHLTTASWTVAVDTAGTLETWPEPGAGPVIPLGEVEWDPTMGDSVVFEIDSATVALWGDTLDFARGARIDLVTPGHRVDVRALNLRLDARPNIHQDTIITLNSAAAGVTFVYDPVPPPPPDGIRIGGTPSWRTVMTLDVPRVLNGPEELCAAVGCPFTLEPGRVNLASLILTTRTVEPTAFQPSDTIRLDVRPVLSPGLLPKSPLGGSFVTGLPGYLPVAPESFGSEAGVTVSVPITGFVQTLLQSDTSLIPSHDLALLSVLEPLSLAFATFAGPGEPGAPLLRLFVTAADTVELR